MVTSGFFNSVDGDRLYDAEQFGSIFDGIIVDGVYENYGNRFSVEPYEGMTVAVKSGRAWFNHTWILNDTDLYLTLDEADSVNPRIDTIAIIIDKRDAVRENSIQIIKGTPASTPARASVQISENYEIRPLAHIRVLNGVSEIHSGLIINCVGTSDCPYVTAPLEGIHIDGLITQWWDDFNDNMANWTEEFNTWFSGLRDDLDTDVAASLTDKVRNFRTFFGFLEFSEDMRYNLNDYCIHNDRVYKMHDADYTPGPFDPDNWRLTNVSMEMKNIYNYFVKRTELSSLENLVSAYNRFVYDLELNIGREEYSNKKVYKVGDYCLYEATLYRMITASGKAEEFKAANWTPVHVLSEFQDVRSNYTTKSTFNTLNTSMTRLLSEVGIKTYNANTKYALGDYCVYNNTLYRMTTASTKAEAFDSKKWTKTDILSELKTIRKTSIDGITTTLNNLLYTKDETADLGTLGAYGVITGSQKKMQIYAALPRVAIGVHSITITTLEASLRLPEGNYVGGEAVYNLLSYATIDAASIAGGTLSMTVTKKSGTFYKTNNVPIAGTIRVRFKVND